MGGAMGHGAGILVWFYLDGYNFGGFRKSL